MSVNGKIIFRVDGDSLIGAGHVMRCLALAQAWQMAGGSVTFVASHLSDELAVRLKHDRCGVRLISVEIGSVADAEALASVAGEENALYIVADGYKFGIEFQRCIKNAGFKLMIVDDNGENSQYCCDAVLNQNAYAHEGLYENRAPDTQLYLGNSYVLLRREFLEYMDWKRVVSDSVTKILVTLGGGDSVDLTCRVINDLQAVVGAGMSVRVVVGGGVSGYEKLELLIKETCSNFSLYQNVSNMADLMAWADISISAAGSTCLEQAFMGLPALLLVVAENQVGLAEMLNDSGLASCIGKGSDFSADMIKVRCEQTFEDNDLRQEMSRRGRKLVDGRGVLRMLRVLSGENLVLRRVTDEDCERLWEWANNVETRKNSFFTDHIEWDEHVKWFQKKKESLACVHYIAENNKGCPLGQIRFDVSGRDATVNLSIDPSMRSNGYGTELIENGVDLLLQDCNVGVINAFVKCDNIPSQHAFSSAGFIRIGSGENNGVLSYQYQWRLSK